MLGHSHAESGALTGLAAGMYLQLPGWQTVALAGFTAGMALLLDLDKCGSSPARSLGFLSETVAWIVGRLTGGHRHLTHSILGVAIFTTVAVLACGFRHNPVGMAGLALLIALTVAGALEALHLTRGHLADAIGIAVAAGVVWAGWGLALIPVAVFVGCCTHIVGDMLTESGCMLLYPFCKHRFHLLGPLAFTTGTKPELYIVDPLLTVGLVIAGLYDLNPAFTTVLLVDAVRLA